MNSGIVLLVLAKLWLPLVLCYYWLGIRKSVQSAKKLSDEVLA